MQFEIEGDLRYAGQHFRVRVALPDLDAPHPDGLVAALWQRFEDEHERRYRHRAPRSAGRTGRLPPGGAGAGLDAAARPGRRARASLPRGTSTERTRTACFSRTEGFVTTRVLQRPDLREPVRGPALVEEDDTTIVIPPGCEAVLDEHGNVVVSVGG